MKTKQIKTKQMNTKTAKSTKIADSQMQLSAVKHAEQVRNGNLNISKFIDEFFVEAKKINDEYNYFTLLCEEFARKQIADNSKGILAGVPISVKDCICVKGVETTASSKILEGYKPVFNATVVQRLVDAGAFVVGKTVQDEFGFGSFSTNVGVGYKIPHNPCDKKRVCGGSSGGAGGFTAKIKKANMPHIALAESTGGSIVAPASFCGVYGLCPTYGAVSRWGLIDYANSLDKIGLMATNMQDIAVAFDIIKGTDGKDPTATNNAPNMAQSLSKGVKGLRIGMITELFGKGIDNDIKKKVFEVAKTLELKGAKLVNVSLPLTAKHALSTYYLIAVSEASTNLAKYCGMRYGASESSQMNKTFDEYATKVRSDFFGAEAKRRIILGTFARMAGYRDAFYVKALKVRTLIIQEYLSAFKNVDVLLSPTMPLIAPTFNEIKKITPLQEYLMDVMTVGPNLAGLPHLNIPSGFSKEMPVGALFIASHYKEDILAQIGGALEYE